MGRRNVVKAIIFDLDGVLLESTEAKTQAFRDLFEDYPEHLNAIVGYHVANGGVPRFDKFRQVYATILKEPLSAKRYSFLCDRYSELVVKKVLASPLVEGAREFLQDYHEQALLFVASGTPSDELNYILERVGLMPYFEKAFGSPAPKPEIVSSILSGWSLSPSEVVLVGDSEVDCLAAELNGIRFIGRVHTASPSSWQSRPSLVTVQNLTELRTRVELVQRPL